MTTTSSAPRPQPLRPELPGLGNDPASVLKRVEMLERVLERSFTIPGIRRDVGLDAIAGLVPVVGDAFDLFFRSNSKNLKILRKHLDKHHPHTMVIDQ